MLNATIRKYEPSYKQLEVKTNPTSCLCGNHQYTWKYDYALAYAIVFVFHKILYKLDLIGLYKEHTCIEIYRQWFWQGIQYDLFYIKPWSGHHHYIKIMVTVDMFCFPDLESIRDDLSEINIVDYIPITCYEMSRL